MTELNSNLWDISPIWSQAWQNSIQGQKNLKKPDISMFDNAPNDVTAWSFFWKILLWVVVWICVAALLFATLSALWWLTSPEDNSLNSIIWVLLPVVWFVVGFVWNLALALLYNIFFSKRYYSFGKMAGLIFASSLIIFIFFFVPYLLYMDNMTALYTMLWFQIIFELFIAKNLIDFLSQPNYSASSLMWNTLWAILAVVVHLVIISMSDFNILLIIASAVIAYIMTAVWSWIWDAVYYKFYEWWNNPFYLPSLNELREERRKEEEKKAKEEEDINVDMK
jgi:hypothetical protein